MACAKEETCFQGVQCALFATMFVTDFFSYKRAIVGALVLGNYKHRTMCDVQRIFIRRG
jgi:hypothetical protein